MAISPIEFNGVVGRTQDFSTVRHNEEQKGLVDQNNFQTHFEQEVKQNISTVRRQDNADPKNKRFDAKDKGDGEYTGDGGRNRKKGSGKESVSDKLQGGFDIKV